MFLDTFETYEVYLVCKDVAFLYLLSAEKQAESHSWSTSNCSTKAFNENTLDLVQIWIPVDFMWKERSCVFSPGLVLNNKRARIKMMKRPWCCTQALMEREMCLYRCLTWSWRWSLCVINIDLCLYSVCDSKPHMFLLFLVVAFNLDNVSLLCICLPSQLSIPLKLFSPAVSWPVMQ